MISNKIKEIELLMKYAVPEDETKEARSLLEEYKDDRIVLNLFHTFYSFLPEGIDDSITKILLLNRKEGVFLLCVITGIENYLYIVSQEKAVFLGRRDEGIWDDEVVKFFGYKNKEECLKKLESLSKFPTYNPAHADESLCPICFTADGEIHTLGCPVEICPWCNSQLTSCHCRFTMIAKEQLKSETDLAAFQEQLDEKGRISFDAKQHRPSFASSGIEVKIADS